MVSQLLIIKEFALCTIICECEDRFVQMVGQHRGVFILEFNLVDDQNDVENHFIRIILLLGQRLVILLHFSRYLLIELLLVECGAGPLQQSLRGMRITNVFVSFLLVFAVSQAFFGSKTLRSRLVLFLPTLIPLLEFLFVVIVVGIIRFLFYVLLEDILRDLLCCLFFHLSLLLSLSPF